jgi:hypothetical protein
MGRTEQSGYCLVYTVYFTRGKILSIRPDPQHLLPLLERTLEVQIAVTLPIEHAPHADHGRLEPAVRH